MRSALRWTPLALAPLLAGCMLSFAPSTGGGGCQRGPGLLVRASAPGEAFVATAAEARLGELLTGDRRQRRKVLVHSPTLSRVARARALDMARRCYFSHTDPDGLGANTLVERAGYRLADHYDRRPQGNNIESLGVGIGSAEAVWRTWMGSRAHRAHLLGENPLFAEQTEYGVGHARVPGSPGGDYWVVLIARPEKPSS